MAVKNEIIAFLASLANGNDAKVVLLTPAGRITGVLVSEVEPDAQIANYRDAIKAVYRKCDTSSGNNGYILMKDAEVNPDSTANSYRIDMLTVFFDQIVGIAPTDDR